MNYGIPTNHCIKSAFQYRESEDKSKNTLTEYSSYAIFKYKDEIDIM